MEMVATVGFYIAPIAVGFMGDTTDVAMSASTVGGLEKDHRVEPDAQSHGWGKHPKIQRVLPLMI